MEDLRGWIPTALDVLARDGLPPCWRALSGPELAAAVSSAASRGSVLRATRGRRTLAVEVDGVRLVVKLSTGDEPRDWWRERWSGAPRSPARREAEALRAALAAGLPVPRPLLVLDGAGPRLWPPRPGRGQCCALVLSWVEHAQHAGQALAAAGGATRRRLVDEALALVARLHGAGSVHRDLYVPHFVLERSSGRLVLLDFGRVRSAGARPRRWFVKDLAALHATAPRVVGERTRLRFLLRWCDAVLGSRAAARPLARAVGHKARALMAHRPIDPGTDRAGWPVEAPA
jgi:hypothetical protein